MSQARVTRLPKRALHFSTGLLDKPLTANHTYRLHGSITPQILNQFGLF